MYFDTNKPVTIQADASDHALGACLVQVNLPVAYASRVLTKTQRKYAQMEKELLSIEFAWRKFDQYICSKKDVIVETARNHRPEYESLQGVNFLISQSDCRAPANESEIKRQYEIYQLKQNEDNFFFKLDEINPVKNLCVSDERLARITAETKNEIILTKLIKVIKIGWTSDGISCRTS
ncbi:uncharacterized protein LOC129236772 [Anastrepha obliqua]|uniref:uncharacterized protein LOC129236772 n=1 Tax=Anastrepha obliqua TaxID=95512 RepID=UPI00240917D8|nr:uncharacterized protein LOC129236772 [Anastrepha obliqua]